MNTTLPCKQSDFGRLVGIDQSTVSRLVKDGTLPREGTLGDWITAYCEHLEAESANDGGGNELRESRAAYFAARARIAQIEADEREGNAVAIDETATFILDLVTRLLQEVRYSAPLIVESVRNWPEREQIRVADDGMKRIFDREMEQRVLARSNCCPAALGVALAKHWTDSRIADEARENFERRIAFDKRKHALEAEIEVLERKTRRSSEGRE